MANSIFRQTLIFLAIFTIANGQIRNLNRVRRSQDDVEQIVDNADPKELRNQDKVKLNEDKSDLDQDRHDQVEDHGDQIDTKVRRNQVEDKIDEDGRDEPDGRRKARNDNQRSTTRDNRRDRVQKYRTQNRDRRERQQRSKIQDQRNSNYERRDQDEDRSNLQVNEIRMFLQGHQQTESRLRNDRKERNGNRYKNPKDRSDQDRSDREDDRRNRYWDHRGRDHKDKRNRDWNRMDRLDLDRINYDNDRSDQYWVDARDQDIDRRDQDYDRRNQDDDRRDQNYERYDQNDDRRDQDYDRYDQNDDRRDQDQDRWDQNDDRRDQDQDRRDQDDDRRDQDRDRWDQDYDRYNDRNDDHDDDDDDEYDRRDQGYDRAAEWKRYRNYRHNVNQVRNFDMDLENGQTRRVDNTEWIRIRKNQNNQWMQYTIQGGDVPKDNYKLRVHTLQVIQPEVKNEQTEPKVLVWEDQSWIRNKDRSHQIGRQEFNQTNTYDYLIEALQLTDRSAAEVLKVIRNVTSGSKDTYYGLEILNVIDSLADHGLCDLSESHYNWIYFMVMPMAIAEVRLKPITVAKRLQQKIDLALLNIAELRGLIETYTTTRCQDVQLSLCDILIKNAINDSPYKDLLEKQVQFLAILGELAYLYLDYLPEYANAVESKQILVYFSKSRARTWPVVSTLISARLAYGEDEQCKRY